MTNTATYHLDQSGNLVRLPDGLTLCPALLFALAEAAATAATTDDMQMNVDARSELNDLGNEIAGKIGPLLGLHAWTSDGAWQPAADRFVSRLVAYMHRHGLRLMHAGELSDDYAATLTEIADDWIDGRPQSLAFADPDDVMRQACVTINPLDCRSFTTTGMGVRYDAGTVASAIGAAFA